jgi:hypothetical protein
MSGRKPPKRVGAGERKPLTNSRLAEIAEIVTDDSLVIGPQDQADLVEALRELVDRRNGEAIANALDEERSAA